MKAKPKFKTSFYLIALSIKSSIILSFFIYMNRSYFLTITEHKNNSRGTNRILQGLHNERK